MGSPLPAVKPGSNAARRASAKPANTKSPAERNAPGGGPRQPRPLQV